MNDTNWKNYSPIGLKLINIVAWKTILFSYHS